MYREKGAGTWSLIEPFAAYGFNKAHAAKLWTTRIPTAYMKANYPIAYMTAILTCRSGDTEKMAEIITESKRMKLLFSHQTLMASFGGLYDC